MGTFTAKFARITVNFSKEDSLRFILVTATQIDRNGAVKPIQKEEMTKSGIFIPDTAKEKPQKGTVVAVGTGKKDEPMTVKVGDLVLYGKYAGTELTIGGTNYLIMRESDIVAIV